MSRIPNVQIPRRHVPWGVGFAFAIFLLYAFVAPIVASGILYPCKKYFPNIEESVVAVLPAEAEASVQDQPNVDEGSTDPDEPTSESSGSSAAVPDFDERGAPSKSDAGSTRAYDDEKIAMQHTLARLLIRSYFSPHYALVALLFFVTVVFLAPLTEEFIFRVVFQGAAERAFDVSYQPLSTPEIPMAGIPLSDKEEQEKEEFQRRNEDQRRRRVMLAILFPALLFAMLHMGVPESSSNPQPLDQLFSLLVTSALANLVTFVLGVFLLVRFAGATRLDFGFEPRLSLANIWNSTKNWSRGILLMLMGAPIVLLINKLAELAFPDAIVAPIPIFVFALYEGWVYYRTRNYATVLGMHMTLNFIGFATLIILLSNNWFSA